MVLGMWKRRAFEIMEGTAHGGQSGLNPEAGTPGGSIPLPSAKCKCGGPCLEGQESFKWEEAVQGTCGEEANGKQPLWKGGKG